MARGRKPKPSATKKLHGNPGKRALNRQEPQFEVEIPDAPALLDGLALEEWNRITEDLAAKQVITRVDMAILALYCLTWAQWIENQQALRNEAVILATPNGYNYQNPRMGLVNTLGEKLKSYAAELGITPSSRSRVKVIGKAPPAPGKKQALAERLFRAPVANK